MVVDPQFLQCVAFLCADEERQKKPRATAFLVCYPSGLPDGDFLYAVTARHVIDFSRPHGDLYLRVNKTGGGVRHLPANQDSWIQSPFSDVAVLPLALPLQEFDYRAIPNSSLLSAEELASQPYK